MHMHYLTTTLRYVKNRRKLVVLASIHLKKHIVHEDVFLIWSCHGYLTWVPHTMWLTVEKLKYDMRMMRPQNKWWRGNKYSLQWNIIVSLQKTASLNFNSMYLSLAVCMYLPELTCNMIDRQVKKPLCHDWLDFGGCGMQQRSEVLILFSWQLSDCEENSTKHYKMWLKSE